MKIYLVGGAVRDKLMGLPVHERDWVVVGATRADMLDRGYRQVGKEFPVFLHPKTNEEYALARMERKVGPGYKGFAVDTSPHVTLEDDLIRRDLTINAMAEDTESGTLIDPYDGAKDIQHRLLRHVSPAFAEDPVRILRVGRFLARYAYLDFHVAPETMQLMQQMVQAGEVNALVAERVWKELERALKEKNPTAFFAVLNECHALPILFPHLNPHGIGMQALSVAATHPTSAAIRFATLWHDAPDAKKTIAALATRYRIPTYYRELAQLTALHHVTALRTKQLTASDLVQLFASLDIFRRTERFNDFVAACRIIAETQQLAFDADWLHHAATIARNVDVQALIAAGFAGNALAERLKEVRIEKLDAWLNKSS